MNMHININDKFITVKKMWFIDEGTEITVTNVSEDDIISFTFGENNYNTGYMDSATFNEHFEKVEEEPEVEIPTITEEYIEEIMENSEFEVHTTFDKCTMVACKLPNGFVVSASSACVSPEDYDKNIGFDNCYEKIFNQVWELEAYRLQQYLWEEELNCDCCCDECDECLYTDLDCDDCDDYNCCYSCNNANDYNKTDDNCISDFEYADIEKYNKEYK